MKDRDENKTTLTESVCVNIKSETDGDDDEDEEEGSEIWEEKMLPEMTDDIRMTVLDPSQRLLGSKTQ